MARAPQNDFSTDTSADYTKFGGVGALSVSGGVALCDTAGELVYVSRDLGLGANHTVSITVGAAGASPDFWMYAKFTDADNFVRLRYDTAADAYYMEKLVGGVYTNLGNSGAGNLPAPAPGDVLRLDITNGGNDATAYRNGVAINNGDLAPNEDVSDVPAGTSAGFRVSDTYTITQLSADDLP